MATQLFLLNADADTHRGTNTAKLVGTAIGWRPKALGTGRGGGVQASAATATVTGATVGVEVTDGTVPYEWLSPPVAADVTISGTITANIWTSENSMSANVAINVVIDIVRSDSAGTIVQIVKSTRVTEEGTSRAAANFTTGMTSGAYTGQTLNRGDRLRVRVFGDDSTAATMASGFTFDASFNGATAAADGDSYITFTENITFESAPGTGPVLINQTVNAGTVDAWGGAGSRVRYAQSFTAVSPGPISTIGLFLSKFGTPTDGMVAELQSDASGLPSGTVLATSATVAGSSLTTSSVLTNLDLTYPCVTGTTYWIVIRRTGTLDASNLYQVDVQTPVNPYAGGLVARFDGSTWTSDTNSDLRFIVSGAATATTTIYLTDTASAVATASVDREAWTSRGAGVANDVTNTAAGFASPIQVTDTAGGTVVDWFTRPLQAFTLGGMAVANIRALESAIAANASIVCEVARVAGDGTSPTVWASWAMSANNGRTGELNTSETAETCNVSGDDLAISDGQRLRIRLYIDDMPTTAMGASQTVTTHYAGTSAGASGDTYITFPGTLAEFASATPGSIIQTKRQRRASRNLTFR